MQRTILMMRHAKTNAPEPGQADFDRTLTIRGLRNTTEMGERLKNEKLMPDLIIASTSRRTRQTAEGMAEALGYDPDKIKFIKKLYHSSPQIIEDVISETDDAVNTILLIAHNPGITEFVNELTVDFEIDDMTTSAIAAAYVNTEHWAEFPAAPKQVFFYTYPKQEL